MENTTPAQISSVISEFPPPVLFSEALNCTLRPFSMVVHTPKEVRKELEEIKTKVTENLKNLTPLMVSNLDEARYDLVNEAICVVEEIKPHFKTDKMDNSDTGLYIVECCISEGEVIPWVIADVNYWVDRPHCKKSVTVPTTLEASTQFEVWAVVRELVEKLISFGFKDSFVNITVQVNTDSSVRIHDLFPGFVHENVPLSRFVYQNGDTLKAYCDISMKQEPHHIKMRPRHLAMKAYINLFSSGSLNNLVDIKQLKSNKHITLSVPENIRIQILDNRPESRLTTPDTSRTGRLSLTSMDNDRSRLTTPDTGRSTPNTSRLGEATPNCNLSRSNTPDSSKSGLFISRSNTLDSIKKLSTADTENNLQLRGSARSRSNSNKSELPTEDSLNSTNLTLDTEETTMAYSPVPQIQLTTDEETTGNTSPETTILVESNAREDTPDMVNNHAVETKADDEESPVIIADNDTGVCIGQMYVYGSTAEDCLSQLVNFLDTAVKVKESCPWLTQHYRNTADARSVSQPHSGLMSL